MFIMPPIGMILAGHRLQETSTSVLKGGRKARKGAGFLLNYGLLHSNAIINFLIIGLSVHLFPRQGVKHAESGKPPPPPRRRGGRRPRRPVPSCLEIIHVEREEVQSSATSPGPSPAEPCMSKDDGAPRPIFGSRGPHPEAVCGSTFSRLRAHRALVADPHHFRISSGTTPLRYRFDGRGSAVSVRP